MPVMRNSEEPWTIKNPDCGSGGRWFESTQLYQLRRCLVGAFRVRSPRTNASPKMEPPRNHDDVFVRSALSFEGKIARPILAGVSHVAAGAEARHVHRRRLSE